MLYKTASYYIEKSDALNFKAAVQRSIEQQMPPNRFMTINLEAIGVDPKGCCAEWKAIRDKIQRYYKISGYFFVCLWVFENSTNNGVHLHALIHEPSPKPDKTLSSIVREHFKTVSIPTRAIKTQPITDLNSLVDYCLKGIRPCHAAFIDRDYYPQGQIIGRRLHWTRNLTPKKKVL